jgi:hypothetical protein
LRIRCAGCENQTHVKPGKNMKIKIAGGLLTGAILLLQAGSSPAADEADF